MDVSDEDPARCRGTVTCEGNHFLCNVSIELGLAKFIYCKKVTKFCEIFPLLLSYVVPVKTKGKILQYFVAFSEYMNFMSQTTINVSLARKDWNE